MARFELVVSLLLCLSVFAESSFWSLEIDDEESDIDYTNTRELTESTEPTYNAIFPNSQDDANENVPIGEVPELGYGEGKEEAVTVENIFFNTDGNSNDPVKPDIHLLIDNLTEAVRNLTYELMKQKNHTAELEVTNKRLQEKIEFIERQTKTNSLLFFNVPESDRESYKTSLNKVLYILNKEMKLKINAAQIAVALRADSKEATTYRPILVRFTNFATKMLVLSSRSRLQQSQVVIESDYSEGVARVRAQLIPYMNAARAQGTPAYLLYDRLVMDGVKYTLQELQALARFRREEVADIGLMREDHSEDVSFK